MKFSEFSNVVLDLTDRPFLVFTDQDGRVKVVYRRDDGHYGLIEPE